MTMTQTEQPAAVSRLLPEVRYLAEVEAAAAGADRVSDIRLAVFLGHANDDAYTELLRVTGGEGEEYTLRLCGTVQVRDREGREYYAGDITTVRGLLERLEQPDHGCELLTNPWFEWINRAGEVVCEPFDSVAIDPRAEMHLLNEIINTRHRH